MEIGFSRFANTSSSSSSLKPFNWTTISKPTTSYTTHTYTQHTENLQGHRRKYAQMQSSVI